MTKTPNLSLPKLRRGLGAVVEGKFVRFHDPQYVSHDRFWATFMDGDFKWSANERFAGRWRNCGHYFARDARGAKAEMFYYTGSNIGSDRVTLEVDLDLENVLDLTNEDYLREVVATFTAPDNAFRDRPYSQALQVLIDQTTGGNRVVSDIGRAAVEAGYRGVLYFGARAISDDKLSDLAGMGSSSMEFDREMSAFEELRKDPALMNLVVFSGLYLTTTIRSYRIGKGGWRKNLYHRSSVRHLDSLYQEHGIEFDSTYQRLALTLTAPRENVRSIIVGPHEFRPLIWRQSWAPKAPTNPSRSPSAKLTSKNRPNSPDAKPKQGDQKQVNPVRDLKGHLITFRHEEQANYADIDAPGRRIVSASNDGTARVWDLESEAEVLTLRHNIPWRKAVNTAHFSADGRYILTAADDNVVHIWDAQNGSRLQVLIGHIDLVLVADWSPVDQRLIASASFDSTARIWDRKKGKEICILPHGQDISLNSASWSSNGDWLVTTTDERHVKRIDSGEAKIWDWRKGKLIASYPHTKAPNDAVFSPEGNKIASASADGLVRIWELGTDKPEKVLSGHQGAVNRVRWSADGKRILSASGDGSAKIWSVDDGMSTQSLEHKVAVISATFSPDGKKVVTAAKDGLIRVWS